MITESQEPAYREEHEIDALTARIGELEDELAATRRELKLAQGNLSLTLNNWEQAKGKIRRKEAELADRKRRLDERDQKAVEEICDDRADYWKGQCERARSEAERYRSLYGRCMDLAHEMERLSE